MPTDSKRLKELELELRDVDDALEPIVHNYLQGGPLVPTRRDIVADLVTRAMAAGCEED